MKRIVIVVTGVLVFLVVAALTVLWLLVRTPYPPQPKFGFTGDWRSTSGSGFDERPLPPASEVWQDYAGWRPSTSPNRSKLYLARLGGTTRQSVFRSWVSPGDTPMGAQRYTNVEFIYTDPINGAYALSWRLRGEHDTRFLRFDPSDRLYQLQLHGTSGESPPKLSIIGIEGIQPEHHAGR